MEEMKVENGLRLCEVKRENLRKTLDGIKPYANQLLLFGLQWNDCEEYLKDLEGNLEKMFREVKSKEMELETKSFALDERVKLVEAAEAKMGDLEIITCGFKKEVEEKGKELDFVKNQVQICLGEYNAEEMRLPQIRKSVQECMVEHRSKSSQLDEIVESLRKTQVDLQRHRAEVSAEMENLGRSQTRRRELEDELEVKKNDLTLVVDKLAECEKLVDTRSSKLRKTQDEIELKGKQLEQMIIDLERRRGEVIAEEDHLGRTQDQSRNLEEEIERKKKYLTAVLDRVAECEKQLESVEEQLDSQKKLLETRSLDMKSKQKEWEGLSLDLDLRVETVNSLNNDLKETCRQIESKANELQGIETLIEERSAHLDSIKILMGEHSEELTSKEKKQNEIMAAIHKSSLEIVSRENTLERAKYFIEKLSTKQQAKEEKLDSIERHLEKCIAEYDSEKQKLRSVKDTLKECLQNLEVKEKELNSLQALITERNKQVEEGEKKMQQLYNSNEELLRQLQVKKEEVCSVNKGIRKCSSKLESKRKHRDQIQSTISDLTAELKSKECHLNSVKKKIEDSLKDFQSKEKEQARLKASLMEREQELALKETHFKARLEKTERKEVELDEKDRQLKFSEQKVAKCVKYCETSAKRLASFVQQGNPDQHEHVNLVRDANVHDEKTLQLLLQGQLKKCPHLHLDVLGALKRSSDPAKLVLDTIQELHSSHQRTSMSNRDPTGVRRSSICLLECFMDMSPKPTSEVQGEAIKFAMEWKNTTLVDAENPVEVLGFLHFLAAFSLAYAFDADKVHNLIDAAFLHKYGQSLCEALGVSALPPGTNEQQLPEAPINNSSDSQSSDLQEMAAVSHFGNEDVLRDHDVSAFSPNEVSTGLRALEDPGKYVLDTVKDVLEQRGDLGLAEPLVKNLVVFLEELPLAVSSIHPNLKLDAAKVARRWCRVMARIGAQLSQLEALGFLQFIVAYGLVEQTKQNETLQFASYLAHLKQAPKLFHSLGLSYAIPNLVKQLLSNGQYIPAIRFMFFFKMNNYYVSTLELLKQEIINLRNSAKENRRFDSQAENRDAAKLRDIIKLIEDLKLEICLPVDLIAKFMVPRLTQNQSQCVALSSVLVQPPPVHMQASHTMIQSSYIATHGVNQNYPTSIGVSPPNQQILDVDTYHQPGGGSTVFHGQPLHQTGSKRPRMDPGGHRPAIRPCFDPSRQ